jgi:hypothetical protein
MMAVQNAFIKDMSARVTAATSGAGEAQGELDAYNALSPEDQALVEPVFHGLTGDQWVAYVTAQKGLGALSDAGLAAGTYKKGASQSSDPRVAAGDKLEQAINNGSVWSAAQLNAWTQEVNAFLAEQTKTSAVNVTLSPAAQTLVSSTPAASLAALKTNSSGLGENVDSIV